MSNEILVRGTKIVYRLETSRLERRTQKHGKFRVVEGEDFLSMTAEELRAIATLIENLENG